MNKKISQFEVTTRFEDHDILTIVQDKTNKIIHKDDFQTSLSETFATNERVDGIEDAVVILDQKVDDNYIDLSNKIVEGDNTVTKNVTGTMNEYYDVLNNTIITLERKHDADMSEMGGTMQEWIDDIDNKSTLDQLHEALNKITSLENLVTALAEQIANGGGGGGTVPGFHTQPTSTIFPLSGYYKGVNADPLATTDTLNQALAKLECQIDSIASSSGSLPLIKMGETTYPSDGTIYTSGKVKEDYLRKDGDTATGYMKFLAGIQGGKTFRSGWDGEGASLWPINGRWKMEVDDLFVRGNMTVNELTVNEIKATGGDILVTIADMECVEVQDVGDGFKCFFDDEDGTKYNQFRVYDQAICQKFDGKNVKRYWRMVSEVGTDYIVLSKSVCESGSAIPEAGDKILQLGHRVESDPDFNAQMDERRNAIFISSKGEGAPRITFYANIDDFSLVGKDRTNIGKDSKFVGTLMQTTQTGDVVRVPIYRGEWNAESVYNYYDQVSYQGSLWIAMKDGVTSVPSKDNDEWQLQVSKGDSGKPGDDVAKWAEITGSRLFLYDTPDYSGIPNPSSLVLTCNTYGMTDPTYEWRLLTEPMQIIGNNVTTEIPYTLFTTRTANIRCVVTDSDGSEYYDDYQIAKLANGAEGLDAYYIDLTNSTVNIPFDSSGNTPLINLNTVYTEIFAYHGITPIDIVSITPSITNGTASVIINGNKVTLSSISSVSATVRLTIKLTDNTTLTKDWYINKTHDGESGFDGVDAAYTMLTGEQIFKYAAGATVPVPSSITLTASAYSIENPVYSWYWSLPGVYEWQQLVNENTSTLVVSPNGTYFTGNEEVTFKVEVTSVNGGMVYTDMMTINKVYDGIDGESVYRGVLSNEAHTVAANYNGEVDPTDLSRAVTEAALWYGTTKLEKNEFVITSELVSGSGTISLDNTNKKATATAINTDSMVWRIHFLVNSKEVDICDFTVTKAKAGAIGNQQISIYYMGNSKPSRPTLTTRPSSSGTSSGGYTWYLDPRYSTTTAVWESKGTIDPNNNGVVIVDPTTGYRWTDPVKNSGEKGDKGDKGDKGNPGSNGLPGDDGLDGPGLNYRGEWTSGKSYGWTSGTAGNIRDVVKEGGYFYMWNKYYRGSAPVASSSNQPSTHYTTVDGTRYMSGTTPAYWTRFGASFESIATGLLFAEKATIAGWEFNNQYIYSQSNTMRLDGRLSPTSSIHLAAGNNAASNPGSAPFRVDTTGKMYASNADITGKITADSGKIGGFTIENGWLKANTASTGSDQNSTYGYIQMNNGDITKIQFGSDLVPASAGGAWTNTAYIQNHNRNYLMSDGSTKWYPEGDKNITLKLSADYCDWPVALDAVGFCKVMGSVQDTTFVNKTGWSSLKIPYQRVQVLYETSDKYLVLPTKAEIAKAFWGKTTDYYLNGLSLWDQMTFEMEFLIQNGSSPIWFRGNSSISLWDSYGLASGGGGGTYTYGQNKSFAKERVTIRYWKGAYYFESNNRNR